MIEQKTITYRNYTLHYSVSGSGTPLILIHGFGENSQIWKTWTHALSQSYRVITPDLPGSGRSDLIIDNEEGLESYTDAIRCLTESENIDRCIMAGHSMGGYITLNFAEKYPNRLKGLCLIHSTCYADNDIKKETRQKSVAFIKNNGSKEFLKTSIPGLFHKPERHAAHIQDILKQNEGINPESMIQYQEAMMKRPDRSHVLKESAVPVFFQSGRYDQAVPFESSLSQCYLPAVSEIQILRSCAHMGMIEAPEESLQGVSSYLSHIC